MSLMVLDIKYPLKGSCVQRWHFRRVIGSWGCYVHQKINLNEFIAECTIRIWGPFGATGDVPLGCVALVLPLLSAL